MLVGQTIAEWAAFQRKRQFDCVNAICMAVKGKTPGLRFELSEVKEQDELRRHSNFNKLQLTITLPLYWASI